MEKETRNSKESQQENISLKSKEKEIHTVGSHTIEKVSRKKKHVRAFLVVQWLGTHLPMLGTRI